MLRILSATALLFASSAAASAQPLPQGFLQLVQAQGVAGYEADVREAVRAQLPRWATPRVDEIGNLIVTVGSGEPHVALLAYLDEGGYVVSRITDDGYLRLHRHTPLLHPLVDQFMLGQPVVVRTATGRMVHGVAATPSIHLRALTNRAEVARIKTFDDLWIDVGASNPEDVAKLGIRLLDPVNLRERAQLLASGRVAGVAGQLRAGAQTLVEILRGLPGAPSIKGTVTFAWTTQSRYGGRGTGCLARVLYFGTASVSETRSLGAAEGQPVSVRKQFAELGPTRATGRSMDDRAGSTALLLALRQIDPATVKNRGTFAWTVEEEIGLVGAGVLARRLQPAFAFGVDTFVSSDAPLAPAHLACATPGGGAVLRGMDSTTVVPPETIDRITALARDAKIPLQLGVTQGGFDSSAFSAWGSVDVGIAWPGRYSHSAVEVIDRRDLESLVRLVVVLVQRF